MKFIASLINLTCIHSKLIHGGYYHYALSLTMICKSVLAYLGLFIVKHMIKRTASGLFVRLTSLLKLCLLYPFLIDGVPSKLLECNGLLSVVALLHDEDSEPCQFHLWTMRDGSCILEFFFHTPGVRKMLWLSRDGKLVYFVSLADELVVFDRSIGKLKHLGVNCFWYELNIIPFVESFG